MEAGWKVRETFAEWPFDSFETSSKRKLLDRLGLLRLTGFSRPQKGKSSSASNKIITRSLTLRDHEKLWFQSLP